MESVRCQPRDRLANGVSAYEVSMHLVQLLAVLLGSRSAGLSGYRVGHL